MRPGRGLLLLGLLSLPAGAAGELAVWVDESGRTTLTDDPSDRPEGSRVPRGEVELES